MVEISEEYEHMHCYLSESEVVEVLWKQDVDLGYSLPQSLSTIPMSTSAKGSQDECEKLKALEELKHEEIIDDVIGKPDNDEWNGVPFTIDNETGEYIRLPQHFDELFEDVLQLTELEHNTNDQNKSTPPSDCPDVNNTESFTEHGNAEEIESILPLSIDLEGSSSELDELESMLQSVSPFYHHEQHRSTSSYGNSTSSFLRQPSGYQPQIIPTLSRGVSMEQRCLQDIANLLSPIAAAGGAPGIPAQYEQFPQLERPALSDLSAVQSHYNIGSAVSSSIHLTNSSHEDENASAGYKIEPDMMYYSNTSSEINPATDGFINHILNDENFRSMRMLIDGNGTSESSTIQQCSGSDPIGAGYYDRHDSLSPVIGNASETTASNGDRLETSSDSAVSSMGSSLSEGEWGEGNDSAQGYHEGKHSGPYDFSYNNRLSTSNGQHPFAPRCIDKTVAQKKHQMFGKRYFQENSPSSNASSTNILFQPIKNEYRYENVNNSVSFQNNNMLGSTLNKDQKMATDFKYDGYTYGCEAPRSRNALEVVNHNHTYNNLPQGSGSSPRPQDRDKKMKKSNFEHISRDEKRARALSIPIPVDEIINLPMDEFNERLSKFELSENQLTLIRDIRRRGKNKVAAQNCRKRKLDQIISLEDEVKEVRKRKDQLNMEREIILEEQKRVSNKLASLHRHIFEYMRDSDGNLCSPSEYSLQQASDGLVYLLRRGNKSEGSFPNFNVDISSKVQSHMTTSTEQDHPDTSDHGQKE